MCGEGAKYVLFVSLEATFYKNVFKIIIADLIKIEICVFLNNIF